MEDQEPLDQEEVPEMGTEITGTDYASWKEPKLILIFQVGEDQLPDHVL